MLQLRRNDLSPLLKIIFNNKPPKKASLILNSLIFLIFIPSPVLSQSSKPSALNYELMPDEHGIIIEKFDSLYTDENRFNHDNLIFRKGTDYFYSYQHINEKGEPYLFHYTDSSQQWKFTPKKASHPDAIQHIKISLKDGLYPFNKLDPDYSQSVISYKYYTAKGPASFGESTGVIENSANIWMHPPRAKYFRILELNPFPYIKFPVEKGKTWEWKLDIGDMWGDLRWKTWHGIITNDYTYEITGMETLQTAVGTLNCVVTEAVATSILGETCLKSFFHPDWGFVRLEYTNIDGSETILEINEPNNITN